MSHFGSQKKEPGMGKRQKPERKGRGLAGLYVALHLFKMLLQELLQDGKQCEGEACGVIEALLDGRMVLACYPYLKRICHKLPFRGALLHCEHMIMLMVHVVISTFHVFSWLPFPQLPDKGEQRCMLLMIK